MQIKGQRRGAILAAHGGACHYCGGAADHIDHIIPRTSGGTDDLGNLIAACRQCNQSKGEHRLPPDIELRALETAEAARDKVLELERCHIFEATISMKVDPEFVRRLTDWRRKQDPIPTVSEALRRLTDIGLRQAS